MTIFQVGEILGERKTGKRGLEFLVRWKGFGKAEDSWEKATQLKDAKLAIDDFRQKAVNIEFLDFFVCVGGGGGGKSFFQNLHL